MEERKSVGSRRARLTRCRSLRRRGYLGFTPGLQLVFVAAQPLVIEAYVFCQRADLLQPHLLCEGALDAVALMDNLTLSKHKHRSTGRHFNPSSGGCSAWQMRSLSSSFCVVLFFWLTGNEGGKTMCLGELLNVPTAMTAFTGMVSIWGGKREILSQGAFPFAVKSHKLKFDLWNVSVSEKLAQNCRKFLCLRAVVFWAIR